MLEIRGITKIYKAKSGVSVTALDNINLTLPERGMIFLLGKSGSGKSTLLNVIGGLDTYDSGEFIIRGKSSRTFRSGDFDAYRNTFIGFIFQEYNILDDFTVGANVGLALELQGKRATDEAINKILTEVDLEGYGARKPNELSGGQKQRIAIARALIKDPQIIMADEPTGALDSTTGEQVLETLKKLSKEKLVIVVSHDRDFAERFGDRIIELADGRVISDISYESVDVGESTADTGLRIISDTQIAVSDGYTLTAEDLAKINAYLASHKNEVTIRRGNAWEKTEGKGERRSGPTSTVATRTYTPEEAKFIRGRLPMRKAAKMGLSSIKSKPVRLIFTILLSLIAFSLFGFADTAIAYDKMVTATSSLRDMEAQSIALSLRLREEYINYDENNEIDYQSVSYYQSDTINDEDIKDIEAKTGLKFFPVYNGSTAGNSGFGLWSFIIDSSRLANAMGGSIFVDSIMGVTEMTEADMTALGFTLKSGRLPTAVGEIVIPQYIYKMFELGGYSTKPDDGNRKNEPVLDSIMSINMGKGTGNLKVVGIVDTGFDFDAPAYAPLRWDAESDNSYSMEDIGELNTKLRDEISKSFHNVLISYPGTIDTLPEVSTSDKYITWGTQFWSGGLSYGNHNKGGDYTTYANWIVGQDKLDQFDIIWVDGSESKTTIGTNDYIIPLIAFAEYSNAAINTKIWDLSPIPELKAYFESKGETADEFFHNLSEHWGMQDYPVFDDEGKEIGTERHYSFAKEYLQISDAEYETKLRNALNAAYGWNLSVEEYRAFANWNYNAYAANNLQNMSLQPRFMFDLMKAFYEEYNNLAPTLMADSGFRQYMIDNFGMSTVQSVNDYISSREFSEAQKRLYVSDLAACYMLRKYDEGTREMYGMNFDDMRQQTALEMFKNAKPADLSFMFRISDYNSGGEQQETMTRTITGVFIPKSGMGQEQCVISPHLYNRALESQRQNGNTTRSETIIGHHISGKYSHLLCEKPADVAALEKLASMHYDTESDFIFKIESTMMQTLDMVDETVSLLDVIFLGIGIGFAVFAAVMMSNFISVSITNKKKEIGILRAVGAQSRDVFLIFFTEAFIIAFINFLLSAAVSLGGVLAINMFLRDELGMDLTLLSFGIRQIALLLGVSVLVALISSFFPTYKIARKQPVDAMKGR